MSLEITTNQGPYYKDQAGQKIAIVFNLSKDRFERYICLVTDTNEYAVYCEHELSHWTD